MEKKQGFFSVLREEIARGLSPSRSRGRPRSESPRRSTLPVAELFLFSRRWKRRGIAGELALPRSGSLTPLMEGPEHAAGEDAKKERGWGHWVKDQLSRAPSASPSASSFRWSDLRMLLGVMAAPLAPIHACSIDPLPHLSIKDTPIETSSAQYILQQYIAASGGFKLLSSIRNTYSMGKVRMVATEFETATRITKNRNATRDAESGGFVLWQMAPEMWYVELSVGGNKVHAGCNSKLVWHHTAWLGAHVAKGPVRPLRRALQLLPRWQERHEVNGINRAAFSEV